MYDGWKVFVISLVVSLVVALAVCALFFFIFVPYWEQRSASVEVPKVTDLTLEEASLILNNRGFMITIERAENPRVPEGTVISQSPPATYRFRKGEAVKLTVSTGASLVEMPSLVGVSVDEAIRLLSLKGLKPGETQKEPSESIQPDHVVSHTPQSGTLVEKGSIVDLVVSVKSEKVKVPRLYGKSLSGVKSILSASGLELGNVKWAVSEEHAFDIVISQYPKPGVEVPEGSGVDITINREAY
jgi:serine/threonine-protein kinase